MKVNYSKDEWYPVFSIEDSSTRTTQYPDGTLEVSKAFYEMQVEIEGRIEGKNET